MGNYQLALDSLEPVAVTMNENDLNEYFYQIPWLIALCKTKIDHSSQEVIASLDSVLSIFDRLIDANKIDVVEKYHPILKFKLDLLLNKAIYQRDRNILKLARAQFEECGAKMSQGTQLFSYPFFMQECARAYFEFGELQLAKNIILEQVMPYNYGIAASHYYLGKIYEAENDMEQAVAQYRKYLELTKNLENSALAFRERDEVMRKMLARM